MSAGLPRTVHYLRTDTLDDAYAKGRLVAEWDGADTVVRPVPYLYLDRQRRAWTRGYGDQRRKMATASDQR